MWLITVTASAGSVGALKLIEPPTEFLQTPTSGYHIDVAHLALLAAVFAAGYAATWLVAYTTKTITPLRKRQYSLSWWRQALLAAAGLIVLYLVGGPLVQSTGNTTIKPMLEQAPELGFIGLAVLALVKIVTSAWSKTMGYRGGLIFPMIFVISACIGMAWLVEPDISFKVALIAGVAGMLVAESKAKVLF